MEKYKNGRIDNKGKKSAKVKLKITRKITIKIKGIIT